MLRKELKSGDRVVHPVYGGGTVIDSKPASKSATIVWDLCASADEQQHPSDVLKSDLHAYTD